MIDWLRSYVVGDGQTEKPKRTVFMSYSKEDILRIAKEEDVKFICLQFTDILGMLKSVSITRSQLEKALSNRC